MVYVDNNHFVCHLLCTSIHACDCHLVYLCLMNLSCMSLLLPLYNSCLFIALVSLAVVNGNNFDDVDSELVAQNCWVDVMLKFRTIAQRPLGKCSAALH